MEYVRFDEAFEVMRYPAGEPHVQMREDFGTRDGVTVIEHAGVRNFDDLGIVLAADAIFERVIGTPRYWFIPYFPFARHDRRRDVYDGLELQVALEMVRGLDVVVADPHSDVLGVLPHVPQAGVVEVYRQLGVIGSDHVLVVPDQGAAKKADEWGDANGRVYCSKHRDPATGALSRFEVGSRPQLPVRYVIVDDICDEGATFIGLARELRRVGYVRELTLAVTHGLFTKGTEELFQHFDHIVTFGRTASTGGTERGDVHTITHEYLYRHGGIR